MKNKSNATTAALSALLRCEKDGAFVSFSSQSEAKHLENERNARLAIAIAHGVIEQKIRLDYVLGTLLARRTADLNDRTRILLRIALPGFFFILYAPRFPFILAENESKKFFAPAVLFSNRIFYAFQIS